MSKVNGINILVYVDGVAIGATKSATLNMDLATANATTKDSNSWEEHIATVRSASVDFDGLYDPAETLNADDLFTTLMNRTSVTLKFSPTSVSEKYYSGEATLTSLKMGAPVDDVATLSGTFKFNGVITQGTVTGS